MPGWTRSTRTRFEVSCRIADQTFRIRTGWLSGRTPVPTETRETSNRGRASPISVIEIVTARQAVAAGAAGCPCCA